MSRQDNLERYETTEAHGLIRLLAALRPSQEVQAPPDLHATLMARIARQRQRRGVFAWVQALALPTPALVLTGLLVVSLAGNGWLGWHYARPSGEPSAQRALATEETVSTLVHKARSYQDANNTARALETYQKAITQGVPQIDDTAFALNQAAWLLYKQQKANEGLPLVRQAIQLRPDNADYLDTLAELLCTMGHQGEAVEIMSKVVHIDPQRGLKLERFQQGQCS